MSPGPPSKTTLTTKIKTRSCMQQPGHGVRHGMGSGLDGSDLDSSYLDRGVAAGVWKFTREWLEGYEARNLQPSAPSGIFNLHSMLLEPLAQSLLQDYQRLGQRPG